MRLEKEKQIIMGKKKEVMQRMKEKRAQKRGGREESFDNTSPK